MRAQLLEAALKNVYEAYTQDPAKLETEELWRQVEDALNIPKGNTPVAKLSELGAVVWREKYGGRAAYRRKVNNGQ